MFDFKLNSKGHITQRESYNLEFKQNFHLGDNLIKYIRTMVGMANNNGGKIIFGVKDSPREPIGMTNDKFELIDSGQIDKNIREYFSSEISWKMESFEFENKNFGCISIDEIADKPIICKKNSTGGPLREGAIYYRYRGETKEIEYAELSKLLNEEKDKEKKMWINHIQKIATIGVRNTSITDLELNDSKHFILDKELAKGIKFIKEEEFVPKEGFKAVVVSAKVDGYIDASSRIKSDDFYTFLTNEICEKLKITTHDFKCILWKLKIKGDDNYHTSVKIGKKSHTNKYSEQLVIYLLETINDNFMIQCRGEYKAANLNNRRKTKK